MASRRTITPLKVDATFETRKRTRARVRGHTVTIDAAVEHGGKDSAANPPETMLAALAGCLNIQVNRPAKERGVTLRRIRVSIDADFDRRAVTWSEDVAVPFPLVRISLTGKSDGSARQLAALRRDVLMQCPVSRVMIEGGSRFRQTWKIDAL